MLAIVGAPGLLGTTVLMLIIGALFLFLVVSYSESIFFSNISSWLFLHVGTNINDSVTSENMR